MINRLIFVLHCLEQLTGASANAFSCAQSFQQVRRHCLAHLVGFGRHTVSALLRAQNRHQQHWSADYCFYSHDRFDEPAVFDQVRLAVERTLEPNQPLVAAMDDSLLRKTGRQIHGVRFARELWSEALNPKHFSDFTTQGDPDQKSEKCEVPLASAAFLSSN